MKPSKSCTFTSGLGTLSICLPGTPTTKLRPRFARRKGKVRTYDSQSEEKETVGWQLKARMEGREPFSGPLEVDILFVFTRPKSREKLNERYHTIKPDIDNLIKFILDCGNGILWYDDKQIANLSAWKRYGDKAQTRIRVRALSHWERIQHWLGWQVGQVNRLSISGFIV